MDKSNLCLFFGLSGTGKTTLSTEPDRLLIGDDEHVWTSTGVFNIEGGCYAKCIKLDKDREPDIFNAIRFGSIIENVVYDSNYVVDYDDTSITENTRCAYPLNYIDSTLIPATTDTHPNNIIFLSCDASGLLPPVSKLTVEQAVFFFIRGYTSKVAGTEVGVVGNALPVFSACFGEPFLIWNPTRYGELLRTMLEKHNVNVWMLNTGWVDGGRYRIPLKYSRAIVSAIHSGSLLNEQYETLPILDLQIPLNCNGDDKLNSLLNPSKSPSWTEMNKDYWALLTTLKLAFDNV
jgi:phosphoenolpyruvate carboxykinase (ATP)